MRYSSKRGFRLSRNRYRRVYRQVCLLSRCESDIPLRRPRPGFWLIQVFVQVGSALTVVLPCTISRIHQSVDYNGQECSYITHCSHVRSPLFETHHCNSCDSVRILFGDPASMLLQARLQPVCGAASDANLSRSNFSSS